MIFHSYSNENIQSIKMNVWSNQNATCFDFCGKSFCFVNILIQTEHDSTSF